MPTPIPPGLQFALFAPDDAVAAFRARGLLPSFAWQDVWQDEHARSFTVAKLLRVDLLGFVHDELDRALTEGASLRSFIDALQPRLAEAGWWGRKEVIDPATGEISRTTFDAPRLKLIYDINLRQSYAAGRWQRAQRDRQRRPLLYYRTMRDERVRKSHAAWDGVCLPADHPFWRTHYPPNGWRCRCTAYPISEQQLERLRAAGMPVKTQAPPIVMMPWRNRQTGEVIQTPAGIDPGWGYNAGIAAAANDALARQAAESAHWLPEPVRSAVVRDALQPPRG